VSQAAVRADRWAEERADEDALVVPFGIEARFLAPKPLVVMPDLHPRVRSRLDDYQLDLIGEVAAIPESALCAVFGSAGSTLRARALGIDPRPVLPPERLAELTASHILATDTNDLAVLHPLLRVLTERLGRRLRRGNLMARRLRLEIGYADHSESARTVPLSASSLDADLWDAARRAYSLANSKRIAVRGVTLRMERVEETSGQLELWAGGPADRRTDRPMDREGPAWKLEVQDLAGNKPSAGPTVRRSAGLQPALDRIHTRYGVRGLTRGSQLAALTGRSQP
jgi:DNA polymerase-4